MAMALQQALAGIRVAEPILAERLQLFPLRWDAGAALVYTTSDDALAAGTLAVTEISEGGSVPTLKVINKGDVMAFLMAGELFAGAKQNRVLNASIMVGADSETLVPVSCVERGRWGYESRMFRGSGSSSHSHLRRKMARDVYESYKATGRPSSRQGEVWREVDRKLSAMGSVSGSDALDQAYADHSAKLDDVIRSVRVPADSSGVVFAFGGRIAGMDLFDKPSTLAKLLPKLVKAYAIDAMEQPATARPVDREAVTTWLGAAQKAACERFDSPGVGDDVRIEAKEVMVGAGLVVNEQPVHVELFPDD